MERSSLIIATMLLLLCCCNNNRRCDKASIKISINRIFSNADSIDPHSVGTLLYSFSIVNNSDSTITVNNEITPIYDPYYITPIYRLNNIYIYYKGDTLYGNYYLYDMIYPVKEMSTIISKSDTVLSTFELNYDKIKPIFQKYYKQYKSPQDIFRSIADKGILNIKINGSVYKIKNEKKVPVEFSEMLEP